MNHQIALLVDALRLKLDDWKAEELKITDPTQRQAIGYVRKKIAEQIDAIKLANNDA